MRPNTDKNERLNRRAAFVLAISLHVALAIALYMQTSQNSASSKAPDNIATTVPISKKAVAVP